MKSIATIFILCASLVAASDKKPKLTKAPEPSPLDRYIAEAERGQATPANVEPSGSLWSPSAQLSDLAMDLRAHRMNDIVTILVNEKASAVSSGTVKTARNSSVKKVPRAPDVARC